MYNDDWLQQGGYPILRGIVPRHTLDATRRLRYADRQLAPCHHARPPAPRRRRRARGAGVRQLQKERAAPARLRRRAAPAVRALRPCRTPRRRALSRLPAARRAHRARASRRGSDRRAAPGGIAQRALLEGLARVADLAASSYRERAASSFLAASIRSAVLTMW